LLDFYNKYKFPIINFDLPEEMYKQKIQFMAQKLKLNSNVEPIFFDKNLKNQKIYSVDECPEQLLDLYTKLLNTVI
jgi:hypothetical protein